MRKIVFIVLIFVFTSSFAIDKKLINGVEQYDLAVQNLEKIMTDLSSKGGMWFWSINEEYGGFPNPEYIDEKNGENDEVRNLIVQYNSAQKMVKKYKPLRNKYYKQVAREEEIKETVIITISWMVILSLVALFFRWFLRLAIATRKKYDTMLAEGKITQAEYDAMMARARSQHTWITNDINIATGLPMNCGGISDAGGSVRGSSHYNDSSSSSSSSSSSNYQRFEDRYR